MHETHPDHRPAGARRRLLALSAASLGAPWLLAGCGAAPVAAQAPAQPDSPNEGPFRTGTGGVPAGVMLEGHDAVAYFTRRAAVPGLASLTLQWRGVSWRFASEHNRAEFERYPARYMPQFGGFCANGINYAVPWGGGGAEGSWRVYRGKLYVFGGQTARDHFEVDTELNLRRAHHYWNAEIAGRSALAVRVRRLVLRVPHYKSDAALQAEWEALRAAGRLPVMPGARQVVPADA